MLTKTEREVCSRMGISVHDYVRTKRARKLGLSINVAGSPFASGSRGRQTVDEAGAAMRASGKLPARKDLTVGADTLLAEAEDALAAARQAHAADPDSDGVWENAAEAAAFIEEALERSAPAYANRNAPAGDDDDDGGDDDDDAESASGPARPFSSHERVERLIGRAITRQLTPLSPQLRKLGAPGLSTVAMPLSAAELAICTNMGIAPSDYAAEKARKRRAR